MPMLPLLLAALLMCLKPAYAIEVRADRDDAEYLELATRYSAAIPLPQGEGVLIAPRWILTSAQVAEQIRRGARVLDIAGRRQAVVAVFVSPIKEAAGVGLVFLQQPVAGIDAVSIYRRDDEKAKGVVIVGHGAVAAIGTPRARRADGRARGAINTVGRVAPATLGLLVKGPEDASDLQGAAGPDDRGAPAFVETPEGLFVAGIALPSGQAVRLGDWDTYARVSAFAPWIDETMFRAAVAETASEAKRR